MGIGGILRVDLTFYTYPSFTSSRKTKIWLISNQIRFEERHIFSQTPTVEKLSFLLTLTTEGIDEILATCSQSFKDLILNIDDLPLSKVVELMVHNPKLLRRPILTDGKKLVVGYQPEHWVPFAAKVNYSSHYK
ncbi:spx/MgsR family transcriptional regulator [Paenisporosarcina sp. HGH0030]|uniref:Spx/MgsR family RNA polymerase-binding regulatory protein n=1 Tax=Paenisporosarcina sp. HGH0030 TaxID=1078085 RepID=UPI00034E8AE1|nr:Spx/MgsR family RNA polymerase-binding regulatory protein [Paenisporosarcina sp. HGH0030]EPD53604.1 spx/MgsR family transcriptional regulator [Paenisporosarcina sp. HGH0030]